MNISDRIAEEYRSRFGDSSIVVSAPGRINLIGEHTDYNNGFVLPAAIHQSVYICAGFSEGDECTLVALDLDKTYQFRLGEFASVGGWQDYILGVLHEFMQKFTIDRGFSMVISGDIPQGAGLSSSAALECAGLMALSNLYQVQLAPLTMARMALNAERSFVGLDCGIMDQYASVFGKKDHVLLIDCMNETHREVPLQLREYCLLLCNSNVAHELADSAYNERRKQCRNGVDIVRREFPHVTSLREVSLEMLERTKGNMDPVVYRRCAYVIRENNRVLRVVDYLQAGDLPDVGQQMYEAHDDMKVNYEVTCDETDFLVELAHSSGKVLGARQMGGGFGGCTINIIKNEDVNAFSDLVISEYVKKFGKTPTFITAETTDGTREL
ncbi:galactokinase [Fulvivirga sedimenti]|uniref:Galactokinase n=1 Tax=Fulvivirga sedimenti TaxID=2879465 RepID=A0A9X1HMY0_9BACT|nr:galactokinase [Fulvivirga sedimenti]MCA6074811.1 galactokinase [Fulvivirga sedimenti]MCA6075988.1 galactokinase [Fulvivirga sedimenti]MCA6077116.1 galactokinase [Fulvivirga sedimenti]